MTRILCVASGILGNRTHSETFVSALGKVSGASVETVWLSPEDYRRVSVPAVVKASDTLHVHSIMAQKLRRQAGATFDVAIATAWDLAPALIAQFRSVPLAVAMDATPRNMYRLRRGRLKWREVPQVAVATMMEDQRMRRILQRASLAIPMSRWCYESLRRDYRVPAQRIVLLRQALDLRQWRPAMSRESAKLRLLFIGTPIVAKGLPRLLAALRDPRLSESCELHVVTADRTVHQLDIPPNVVLHDPMPHASLVGVFQQSDVFVLPTLRDCSPNVLVEAAATGLGAIASDVGAIGEVVRHGTTGILLAPDSPAEDLAAAIWETVKSPDVAAAWGRNARQLALETFSRDAFDATIAKVVERLHNSGNR